MFHDPASKLHAKRAGLCAVAIVALLYCYPWVLSIV